MPPRLLRMRAARERVAVLAEELERLLGVQPGDEPVAAALGDERGLEEGAGLRGLVGRSESRARVRARRRCRRRPSRGGTDSSASAIRAHSRRASGREARSVRVQLERARELVDRLCDVAALEVRRSRGGTSTSARSAASKRGDWAMPSACSSSSAACSRLPRVHLRPREREALAERERLRRCGRSARAPRARATASAMACSRRRALRRARARPRHRRGRA